MLKAAITCQILYLQCLHDVQNNKLRLKFNILTDNVEICFSIRETLAPGTVN